MKNSLVVIINFNKIIFNLVKQTQSSIETLELFSLDELKEIDLDKLNKVIIDNNLKIEKKVNVYIVDNHQYNHKVNLPKTNTFSLGSQITKEIKTRFNKLDYYYSVRTIGQNKKGLIVFNTVLESNTIDLVTKVLDTLNFKIEYIFGIREILEIKAYQNNYANGLISMNYFDQILIGIVKQNKVINYLLVKDANQINASILRLIAEYQYQLFKEPISTVLVDEEINVKDLDRVYSNNQLIYEIPKQMKQSFYKRIK